MFYPLMGKGVAVSMCYRALYIGSGEEISNEHLGGRGVGSQHQVSLKS